MSLVLGVLFVLMIAALKIMENSGESLEKGIEGYLSEVSGMNADIKEMGEVSFFPDVDIVLKDIQFYTVYDPSFFPLHIDEISFSMPFFSVFFRQKVFERLSISGLKASAKIMTPFPIEIMQMEVVPAGETPYPALVLKGVYNGRKLFASIEVEKRTYGRRIDSLYAVAPDGQILVEIGDISLRAVHGRDKSGAVFRQTYLTAGKKTYGPKDIALKDENHAPHVIDCLLDSGGVAKSITPDCLKLFE